ncbi:MAG: glycosyltransferase [Spirochaetes bacterium]|nr:glycosyltransferase [Spirochaetota bacterium]
MNSELQKLLENLNQSKGYFITATYKDKDVKDKLNHDVIRKEFIIDDIVPSVDKCLRSMDVKLQEPIEVVKLKPIEKEVKPLKIAIITHFNRCPDHYSPGKQVKSLIQLLQQYGHEVTFFLQEGSQLDAGCKMMPVVPKFRREKGVVNEEIKKKFIEILRREVDGKFDIVITQDLYIDDCITYRNAIKESGIKATWLHWARSGIGRSIDFAMPNARYIYMNYADVDIFSRRINVSPDKVRVVFNQKDPALLWGWNPITKYISDYIRLWEKDIVQVYPICTTRMDCKGINSIIQIFGELKKAGKKVALIICNSNGRRRVDEIQAKVDLAKTHGLTEEDFLITSTLANDEFDISRELPHKVVVELLQTSNLFVFPTMAEVCSNVLLEASMTKNLLVLNDDVPSLFDFADKDAVLKYPFTSLRSVHYTGRSNEELKELIADIIKNLDENKADKQFRKVWRTHSMDSIYNKMLKQILYE